MLYKDDKLSPSIGLGITAWDIPIEVGAGLHGVILGYRSALTQNTSLGIGLMLGYDKITSPFVGLSTRF
jgi:hypothetical protein